MNLRPSGYEPDELPGCSIPRRLFSIFLRTVLACSYFAGKLYRIERLSLIRFGGDLLSHVLRRSTIGATALNGRVRDGIGCFARAMTTKPEKRQTSLRRMSLSCHRKEIHQGFGLIPFAIVPKLLSLLLHLCRLGVCF